MEEKISYVLTKIKNALLFLLLFKIALKINFEILNPHPSQKMIQALQIGSVYSSLCCIFMIGLAGIFAINYFNPEN